MAACIYRGNTDNSLAKQPQDDVTVSVLASDQAIDYTIWGLLYAALVFKIKDWVGIRIISSSGAICCFTEVATFTHSLLSNDEPSVLNISHFYHL